MTDYLTREKAALQCALILFGVVLIGTVGFSLTESDWTVWRSLYFTLITVTTVGYGDEGLSSAGEKVAALLLLGGIGGFTYSISTLVQLALDREGAQARKMINTLKDWDGHVVVCGYGRMGKSIWEQLTAANKKCVVIEEDEIAYQTATRDGVLTIRGVASEDDVLETAGVDRAAAVVAAVNSDAENMYIIVSARDLNANCSIIARAESQSAARKMERAGATFVVLPHMMAGESIATAILYPRLTHAMRQGGTSGRRLTLAEAIVCDGSELVGKTIQEYGSSNADLVFVAIESQAGELVVRPPGNHAFHAGDVVICAGRREELRAVCEAASAMVAV